MIAEGEPFDQGAERGFQSCSRCCSSISSNRFHTASNRPDRELGDRRGRDTGGVGDHDRLGKLARVEVVDPGADRLHPAQTGREFADVLREVERERRLGARPHCARSSSLSSSVRSGR